MKNLIYRLAFLKQNKGTGALQDDRSFADIEKDYLFKEIVANAEIVDWKEKTNWNKYPIFDQNGSGSCVAQSVAKMLGIIYSKVNNGEYVHFSATHVYQQRSNKPEGGMIGVNALDIARNGITLEDLVPSQKMTDYQMDSVIIPDYKKKVGEIFKVSNYVLLPTQDIDIIASTIQKTGKPVMVWFYFNHDEWTTWPEIKRELVVYGSNTSRHSVVAVDFFLKNGKKYLVIEDSWGTSYGEKGQRFISEDFFKVRNFFSAYMLNFKFNTQEVLKPILNIQNTLKKGMQSIEVINLQDILKYLGLFPSNVDSTGYFGSITEKAVKDFQKKYNLIVDGIVGQSSINKLKELIK